ncbi:MAG: SIS domain-containing protein, partial [Acidimicrobiia bacterium]|nr:SIS domain-containing protein [Acidimicrobiia bacterium]
AITAAFQDGLDSVDDATIAALAVPIATTRGRVLILCAETSAAPGRLLADNLGLLRPGVQLLAGSSATMAADLADVGATDVVMVIDFPRYEATIVAAAEHAADRGATVLAVTDGPLSPLATVADTWVGVPIQAIGPFDSILPAVVLAELLIAEVADLLRTQATTRLDRIEALWSASGVFDRTKRSGRFQEES